MTNLHWKEGDICTVSFDTETRIYIITEKNGFTCSLKYFSGLSLVGGGVADTSQLKKPNRAQLEYTLHQLMNLENGSFSTQGKSP